MCHHLSGCHAVLRKPVASQRKPISNMPVLLYVARMTIWNDVNTCNIDTDLIYSLRVHVLEPPLLPQQPLLPCGMHLRKQLAFVPSVC